MEKLQDMIRKLNQEDIESFIQTISNYYNNVENRKRELRDNIYITRDEQEELRQLEKQGTRDLDAIEALISARVDAMSTTELESYRNEIVRTMEMLGEFSLEKRGRVSQSEALVERNQIKSSLENKETRELYKDWLKLILLNKAGIYIPTHNFTSFFEKKFEPGYISEEEKIVGELPIERSDIPAVEALEKETAEIKKKYQVGYVGIQVPNEISAVAGKIKYDSLNIVRNLSPDRDHSFGTVGNGNGDTIYVNGGITEPRYDPEIVNSLKTQVEAIKQETDRSLNATASEFAYEKMQPLLGDGSMNSITNEELVRMHKGKIEPQTYQAFVALQARKEELEGKIIKTKNTTEEIAYIKQQMNVAMINIKKQIKQWYINNQNIPGIDFRGKGEHLFDNAEALEDYLIARDRIPQAFRELESSINEIERKVEEAKKAREDDLEKARENGLEGLRHVRCTEEERKKLVDYIMKKEPLDRDTDFLKRVETIIEEKEIRNQIENKITTFKGVRKEEIDRKTQIEAMMSDYNQMTAQDSQLQYSSSNSYNR